LRIFAKKSILYRTKRNKTHISQRKFANKSINHRISSNSKVSTEQFEVIFEKQNATQIILNLTISKYLRLYSAIRNSLQN